MAENIQITAQVPANKEKGTAQLGPATISIPVPETAKEMIAQYGDEAVKTNALANWKVTIQSNMRAGLKKGETQEQMQARLGDAKMGVSAKGASVNPEQAFQAKFMAASDEERAKMIKELQKRAQELKA